MASLLVVSLGIVGAACTDSVSGGDGSEAEAPPASPASPIPEPPQGIEPANGWMESACNLPLKILRRLRRDYHPKRSPELVAVPHEPNYFGGYESTSHSGPWDYIQRVPIVFYGPGVVASKGKIAPKGHDVTVADIAPTMAEMLGVKWPQDRAGVVLEEALVPEKKRSDDLRLVVTIVWDGGGWDVLESWPDHWPFLKKLMRKGTVLTNGTAGSSPSVTPAIHANLGTGAFPDQHAIVDIPVRGDDGRVVNSWDGKNPQYLELDTIGDIYDPLTDNRAEVGLLGYKGWHLGMLGHGSAIRGGDKDLAALISNSGDRLVGNEAIYELPAYATDLPGIDAIKEDLDAADGQRDDRWLDHDVLNDPYAFRHETPGFILYQTDLAKMMLEREGYGRDDVTDLFFMNYKPIDSLGHNYNMVQPEVGEAVRYADQGLKELSRFLDGYVGKGKWALALTADHGQTPLPTTTGGWAINKDNMMKAAAEHFDVPTKDMFDEGRPQNFWLHPRLEKDYGVTTEEIADFLLTYTMADNAPEGNQDRLELDEYRDRVDDPLLAAAYPTDQTEKVWKCATG